MDPDRAVEVDHRAPRHRRGLRALSHGGPKIGTQVEDAEKRHRYRKRVGYAIAVVVFVVLGIAFFQKIREMGTLLGFISAGLAIALREYLASFLAWFYILGQRNIALGGRIEVSGVRETSSTSASSS